MRRYVLALCTLLLFGVSAPLAHADFGLSGISGAAMIHMSPEHPAPKDTVHLSLESSLVDISSNDVVWYVNGTQRIAGQGIEGIDVTAGKLGVLTSVEADITTPDGTVVSAHTDIIPTEIDLLWNADSYTPPFYRGRALAAPGTSVQLSAMARFSKVDGSMVPARDIVYTWRRDGQVLGSLSGRGRDTLSIPAPFSKSQNLISVEAHEATGDMSGEASVLIPSTEPSLRLYEDHPLFGLRFGQALATSSSLSDTEMTFAAIPYFASAASPNDASLLYEWTVNDRPVETSDATKNEIALGGAHSGAVSSARITLSMSHARNFFFDLSGVWTISIGAVGGDNIFENIAP